MMLIANILGILIFFFLLWRTLKDDYHYEKIFNSGFIILIAYLTGLVLIYYFKSIYWFWIMILFVIVGFLIAIKSQKMKFFESFEALVISLLPVIGLCFLSDAITKSSLSSFLAFWMTLICVFVYFFLITHYRSFTWYRSGKVGFSGVVTLTLFFLIRIIASLVFNNAISLAGKFEPYLSGSTALLLIILLYNLFRNDEN